MGIALVAVGGFFVLVAVIMFIYGGVASASGKLLTFSSLFHHEKGTKLLCSGLWNSPL